MANPFPTSTRAPGGWLGFWIGILVTVGLVAALVQAWPDDDPRTIGSSAPVTPTTRFGVPELPEGIPDLPDLTIPGVDVDTGEPIDLFAAGSADAVAEVLAAAGATELHELGIYPQYLFVTYRDPGDPGALVRRMWRNGAVDEGAPDTSAGTDLQAGLFAPTDVDLGRIPAVVADAPSRYDIPVTISHILINRFLPFDERVLIRVYAVPVDGSPTSGGGYVSYTGDGTFVDVCC